MATSTKIWQDALSHLITDPKELLQILQLDESLLEAAIAAARIFPLKATRSFVARMQKGNPHDPLLKQILPLGIELEKVSGYVSDPLEEKSANHLPGLLHKYHGRVLVTLTSACAVHCRYCFRRAFPYADNNPGRAGWEKIIDYIRADDSIQEVILSGGDPLSVSDRLLALFTDQLKTIPHVKTLRFHTRMPVVLPERVTDELLSWLKQLPWQCVIVIHANHANEINHEVREALQRLREANVHLLNQAVLLKGVNDETAALVALSETLFAANVLPYYLHVLDKVEGAAHFDLPLETAQRLHAEMTDQLPGYLVPRLVREVPGEGAKRSV